LEGQRAEGQTREANEGHGGVLLKEGWRGKHFFSVEMGEE